MKIISLISSTVLLFTVTLYGEDWEEESWDKEPVEENSIFEQSKIKNRSKKTYDDKVYKYITGDYKVENNNIELANIYIDDGAQNDDIEINIITDNLRVEGDSYRDSIDIKRNRYKNFVQNDERGVAFFEEEVLGEEESSAYSELGNSIQVEDSRYNEVIDEDVSQLETLDLRGNNKIKEVNVFIEDVHILVD